MPDIKKRRDELEALMGDLFYTGGMFAWDEPDYMGYLRSGKSRSEFEKDHSIWYKKVNKELKEIKRRNGRLPKLIDWPSI